MKGAVLACPVSKVLLYLEYKHKVDGQACLHWCGIVPHSDPKRLSHPWVRVFWLRKVDSARCSPSQNHRVVERNGKELWRSPSPAPRLKQGLPEQGAQAQAAHEVMQPPHPGQAPTHAPCSYWATVGHQPLHRGWTSFGLVTQ